MMNTAVIELMLQLPGLDKDMIVNVSVIITFQFIKKNFYLCNNFDMHYLHFLMLF